MTAWRAISIVFQVHVHAWRAPLQPQTDEEDSLMSLGVPLSVATGHIFLRPLFVDDSEREIIFVRGQGGVKSMQLSTIIVHARSETEALLRERHTSLSRRLDELRLRCAELKLVDSEVG